MGSRFQIPYGTKVEVIALKGVNIVKREMTYSEALNIKRKKGWTYKIYQLGFSQFKTD